MTKSTKGINYFPKMADAGNIEALVELNLPSQLLLTLTTVFKNF